MYRLSHSIKGSFDLWIVVLPDDRENVKLLVPKCSFSSVYTSYVFLSMKVYGYRPDENVEIPLNHLLLTVR